LRPNNHRKHGDVLRDSDYPILPEGLSLPAPTSFAQRFLSGQKYANRPDFLAISMRALAYFEDAEQQPMPRMYHEVRWENVKAYCQAAARKLARGLAGLN
jgi:hypothetical protein